MSEGTAHKPFFAHPQFSLCGPGVAAPIFSSSPED